MKEVKRVKKWSKRRKWWLALMLILPIVAILRILVSTVFWFIANLSVSAAYEISEYWYDYWSGTPLIYTIKAAINRLLWMISTFWLISFIPWLIMLLKPDTDYDPNIELKTKSSDLDNVYETDFDINSLEKSDIQEMKYNWLITKLHIAWAVIFNILTLWVFSTMYYWLRHSDLPKIRKDDFSAWKAIWYLFIPFYNLYWVYIFWTRFVDRLNFQHTIRNGKKPVSRGLMIAFIIIIYVSLIIPYIGIVNIIIWSILAWQMQSAINGLVEEKENLWK